MFSAWNLAICYRILMSKLHLPQDPLQAFKSTLYMGVIQEEMSENLGNNFNPLNSATFVVLKLLTDSYKLLSPL